MSDMENLPCGFVARTLQSGFCVIDNDTIVSDHDNVITTSENRFISIDNSRNIVVTTPEYGYSKTITELYEQYTSLNSLSTEQINTIIKTASKLFGKSFHRWLYLQTHSSSMIKLHLDYLVDTLSFIHGNPRSVSNQSWVRVLTCENINPICKSDIRMFLHKLTKTNDCNVPDDICHLIYSWLCNKDGVVDLLNTLYVLTGKR